MKKVLVNYGGIILFYLIIVFGMLFLCNNSQQVPKSNSSFGISTSQK